LTVIKQQLVNQPERFCSVPSRQKRERQQALPVRRGVKPAGGASER
jgi:hypothetical protein